MNKVCSKTAIWIFVLMLIVPGSVLLAEDPPTAQDQSMRKAQSVAATPVPPALHQALVSSLSEATSIGEKSIPTPPTGSWGIVSEGDGGGAIFRDSDSEAEAWLGAEEVGVHGFGDLAGGHFADSVDSGEAWVGHWHLGIEARGSEMGGYFEDSDGSGFAHLGWGNTGVFGRGNVAGGSFDDGDGSGYARVGYGDRGVDAGGTEMGGYFADSDGTAHAYVGYGDYGVRGGGNQAGGYFEDLDGTGWAEVASGNRGIQGWGTEAGGFFADSDQTAHAYVGYGDWGIEAHGNVAGGYFKDKDGGTGFAYLGHANYGIEAHGSGGGGYFNDSDGTAHAYVGYGEKGIVAHGIGMGGHFENVTSSGTAYLAFLDQGIEAFGNLEGGEFWDVDEYTYSDVAYGSYSISGNGAKAFVQNHPYEGDSVIVYAALEGDEVATYTRGTARLVEGEATVLLGETFNWVTNPDIGLTAHLTPRGEPIPLAVVGLSTEKMTVRAPGNAPEGLVFDFIVFGLRIGFEESSIVQEKEQESYIPSMAGHRQLYERRPDLKSYNSLERFKGMHHVANPKAKLDLSRAQTLRDAIIEFDPAVHELPKHSGHEERPANDPVSAEAQRGAMQRVRAARVDRDRHPATDQSDLSATTPVDDGGNIYAPSFRPPSREVATLVDLSESVEPGDVLVIDRDTAGLMRRGFEGHDSGVVGIVLDSQSPAISEEEVEAETALHAEVAMAGVVRCKVDAEFGAIWPGDLLVTSPTSGHAMRTESPLPGTIVGKALEPLEEGTGTIRVLVMLR